jgi:16S rRNA G966 N2-methylase RsmD
MFNRLPLLTICLLFLVCGCTRWREDLDYAFEVEQTWVTDDLGGTIVQFTSVPYQPLNTLLLRSEIASGQRVDSRRVLELGSGTGYFAIRCAGEGAKQVVVLAPNRAIHACVRYNVAVAQQDSVVDARLVEPRADAIASAIAATERFDYVVVNTETTLDEPLILAAIEQLPTWLRAGGKGWVICETEQTKAWITERCQTLGFQVITITSTDKTLAIDPAAFPQTLQIDPFTPAAVAKAASEASEPDSGAK